MAAGTALAGPLAGRSVTACLLIAAGFELSEAIAAATLDEVRTAMGMRY
jgi:hypothetical protein